MFVLYLMNNETHDYHIFRRRKRPLLRSMYNNESRWIVPGTMSADDQQGVSDRR